MSHYAEEFLLPCVLMAYFLGSIPTGLIIAYYKGVNIRKFGSGNIGAVNVGRALGKKYEYITMIIDAFKAWFPIFLAMYMAFNPREISLIAIAVLSGNLMSCWMDFKGGKGASHAFGIMLAIDWRVAIAGFMIRKVITWITNISSIGTLTAVVLSPILIWKLGHPKVYIILFIGFAILIFYAHRANIKRLIAGTENPLYNRK